MDESCTLLKRPLIREFVRKQRNFFNYSSTSTFMPNIDDDDQDDDVNIDQFIEECGFALNIYEDSAMYREENCHKARIYYDVPFSFSHSLEERKLENKSAKNYYNSIRRDKFIDVGSSNDISIDRVTCLKKNSQEYYQKIPNGNNQKKLSKIINSQRRHSRASKECLNNRNIELNVLCQQIYSAMTKLKMKYTKQMKNSVFTLEIAQNQTNNKASSIFSNNFNDELFSSANSIDLNAHHWSNQSDYCHIISTKHSVKKNNSRANNNRRLKRHQINQIVQSTREKLNQTISTLNFISKQRDNLSYNSENIYPFNSDTARKQISELPSFMPPFSDSNSNVSFRHLIEQSSQARDHLIMQCRETQVILSSYSPSHMFDEDFFEEEYKTLPIYENSRMIVPNCSPLNNANRPLPKSAKYNKKKKNSKQQIICSNSTLSESRNFLAEAKSSFSSINIISSADELSQTFFSSTNLPKLNKFDNNNDHDDNVYPVSTVPEWDELCERIYRFKLKSPTENVSFVDDSISTKESNLEFANGHVSENDFPSLIEKKAESQSTKPLENGSFDSFNSINTTQMFSNNIDNNNSNVSQHKLNQSIDKDDNHLEGIDHMASLGKIQLNESVDNNLTKDIDFELRDKIDAQEFVQKIAKYIFTFQLNRVNEQDEVHSSPENFKSMLDQLAIEQFEDELGHGLYLPSVKAYQIFLLDLCKEIVNRTFSIDSNNTNNKVPFSLMLPLRSQKQPWPSSEEQFVQIVLDKMKLLLMPKTGIRQQTDLPCDNKQYKGCDVKRFGLMAYCRMQRKLDIVDTILYNEMLEDEHLWSIHGLHFQ